ncbi:MAG: hypothetical protein ACR2KK_17110 [Acidimicrobiales bacterium]
MNATPKTSEQVLASTVVGRSPRQYRQGDVLLQRVPGVPDKASQAWCPPGARCWPSESSPGTPTSSRAPTANSSNATRRRRFVTLPAEGVLTHEEQAPIAVPAGTYEVVRQREYRPRPQPSAPPWSAWVVE